MKLVRRHKNDWLDQTTLSFWTMGPIEPEHRDAITALFRKVFGSAIKNMIVSAEVSNTGYKHVHVGLDLYAKMAYAKAHKTIQKALLTICGPRDSGENYSCTVNKVPKTERIKGEQLYGFAIVEKYLQSPTKLKQVGDVEQLCLDEEWTPWHYFPEAEEGAARMKAAIDEPGITSAEKNWRQIDHDNFVLGTNYCKEMLLKHTDYWMKASRKEWGLATIAVGTAVERGCLRPKKFNF